MHHELVKGDFSVVFGAALHVPAPYCLSDEGAPDDSARAAQSRPRMNAFHRGVRTSARAGALLRKLAEMAVTLLLATLVLFVLTHMAPGDPVRLMLGEPEIGTANSEAYRLRYAEMRRELRLDDNLFLQYGVWLGRLFRFDLGRSIHTRRPVRTELLERLPATLQLALPALSLQRFIKTIICIFDYTDPRDIFKWQKPLQD